VIIVPLGILAVVRLIPADVMAEHRHLAAAALDHPVSRTAAVMIGCIWVASAMVLGWLAYRWFAS
jgi:hypothetical protein